MTIDPRTLPQGAPPGLLPLSPAQSYRGRAQTARDRENGSKPRPDQLPTVPKGHLMEQTVKCKICGKPYVFYGHLAGDQSACPKCRAQARKELQR